MTPIKTDVQIKNGNGNANRAWSAVAIFAASTIFFAGMAFQASGETKQNVSEIQKDIKAIRADMSSKADKAEVDALRTYHMAKP